MQRNPNSECVLLKYLHPRVRLPRISLSVSAGLLISACQSELGDIKLPLSRANSTFSPPSLFTQSWKLLRDQDPDRPAVWMWHKHPDSELRALSNREMFVKILTCSPVFSAGEHRSRKRWFWLHHLLRLSGPSPVRRPGWETPHQHLTPSKTSTSWSY